MRIHLIHNEDNKIRLIEDNSEEYSMLYLNYINTSSKDDLLGSILDDILGDDLLIPYNIEDRKKKFSKAFKELEPYMRKYLAKK
jgi:hypothetical protein